ncbi:MAG: alpha/beta hydrolase [Polyangiaceae bacterium]|nr:alpha/beta hydrolase [Polyangiaceae bacterium]
MDQPNLLPGITSAFVETPRLRTHILTSGPENGRPVVFIHGNASGSRFFEETMLALPKGFRGIALDLRGFGESEVKPLDATRGLRDFSDDLHALLSDRSVVREHEKVVLVGWSVGGGVAMQYAIDHPATVAKIVLLAPMSPFGFGGTKDVAGTPCWGDHAGSGGGTANPEFVKRIKDKDTSEESDFSPRNVMSKFYWKPPFRPERSREDAFLAEVLKLTVRDENYPGNFTASTNWPGLAPGEVGMNNALSPRYVNLAGFADIDPKPDVLWIRGADDQIVSDTSLFDFGFLGQLGVIPGWPGAEVYPPQPMLAQIRSVLDAYRAKGGFAREEVIPNAGHSPHIEAAEAFNRHLAQFLGDR